jgi:thioredoxin-related protein
MILRIMKLLLAMLAVSLAQADSTARDPYAYFFQDTFGDFTEEVALAREEGKQAVLLFFEQEDCPFCFRMKTTILNRPEVQDYFRAHFRIFSVDIEGDLEVIDFNGVQTTQKEFAFKQFNVRATPVIAFFDLDGKLITRHTGVTRNAREFLWLGEFIVDGHFRTQTFTAYKRDKYRQTASE